MVNIHDIKINSALEINNALKEGHIWVEELGSEYLHELRPANCLCYGDLSPQEEEIYFAAHIGGCLNTEQEINAFKDQILGLILQKKPIFDNYKNEAIIQTERELRERLSPYSDETIERTNWREKLRTCRKREDVAELKEYLLNLATEIKRIRDEHEEWKRDFQAERQENQTERENRQRELQERERAAEEIARAAAETSQRELEQRIRNWETEEENCRRQIAETIRQVEERAREEAQKWLQEQQEKNQRTGDEEKTEESQKKENLHSGASKNDDELSQECQAHLKKTAEYLNSLDSTKNFSQRPNKRSEIDSNSGQGKIKKRDGEQIQSDSTKNINPESYQSDINLKNADKKRNVRNHSPTEPQIVKVVESPMEPKKPTLLIIGIVLIIGSVLATGYLLGKRKKPN